MRTIDESQPAAHWFATKLRAGADRLGSEWRWRIDSRLDIDPLPVIAAIAEGVSSAQLPTRRALQSAAALATWRYRERASIGSLLADFDILSDLLATYLSEAAQADLSDQATQLSSRVTAVETLQALHAVNRVVRELQQHAVATFAAAYADRLEQQARQIRRLNRIVAHEMRQPLGVLQLMHGVYPVRAGDLELTRLLDVFDRNVRRLADVAARLERISHDSSAGLVMSTEQPVDLNELVASVVGKLRGKARERDVHVQIDAELPVLSVDPARTELVFTNVIGNAIRYADAGKAARLVEVLSDRRDHWLGVMVRDNGVGIRPGRARQLFREFSRAHAYRDHTETEEGLGLGLSIVRDCMDAAGGTVHLESTEGRGTTITLVWPAHARVT